MPAYGLPPLPKFRDGAFLGAGDLNRIGQVQAYIQRVNVGRPNIPFERMGINDNRLMVHHSRYLRWVTASATAASLRLNGEVIDTASGADSGVVDLSGYGFQLNQLYELMWTGTAVICTRLYESPSADGVLVLPASDPTFTTGANADQLNALSTNTQYLLDNAGRLPNRGFVSRTRSGFTGSQSQHFVFTHQHRYLYWSGDMRHGGDVGQDLDTRIRINETLIWHDGVNGNANAGGRYKFYETWYDLQGTDHTIAGYTATGSGDTGAIDVADGSSLGLSVGDEYTLRLEIESETRNFEARAWLFAEFPQKAFG